MSTDGEHGEHGEHGEYSERDMPDDPKAGSGAADITCQELVELVTAYREGQLPQSDRTRFEAHLSVCPPCVSYVEQMDLTVRALGGLDEQSVKQVEEDPATQELLNLFRSWKAERQQIRGSGDEAQSGHS